MPKKVKMKLLLTLCVVILSLTTFQTIGIAQASYRGGMYVIDDEQNISDYQWSPDGKQIVYSKFPDGQLDHGELWVANRSENSAKLRDFQQIVLPSGNCEIDNMQPYTALNYIIALQGIFPPRNAPLGGGGAGVASVEPYIGEIVLFAGNFAPRGWAFCDGQLLPIYQYTALFSILGTTYGGDGRTTFALPDLRGRVPVHEGTGPGLTPRPLGQKGGSETGDGASEFDNMQPYTTLNCIIALQGIFPPRNAPLGGGGAGVASADPYIGEIVLFAGNFAPRGWAFCDGQLLPINQNTALFSILGTTYGGDGRTTFALPDLRGRVPVHAGTGPGLTLRPLGQKGGSETGDGACASEFGNMQPYTTLNCIIALLGTFPSRNAPLGGGGAGVAEADPFLGQIVQFAGNFAPRGWAFCDGQLLPINQNQALFSILGTTYGGDGRTTFALPDLRGRVPVHAGTGPGLTIRPLGQKGGSETQHCDCADVRAIEDWYGDWILFRNYRNLWKVKADGSGYSIVTKIHSANYGRFIPGTDLVYFSGHTGDGWWQAQVCNIDGSGRAYVNPDKDSFTIAMSPAGDKFLYGDSWNSHWHDIGKAWQGPTDLWVSNADGSGGPFKIARFDYRTVPYVLADGHTVIFRHTYGPTVPASLEGNIYAIDMDGTNRRTVLDDTDPNYLNYYENYHPTDGQMLLMRSNRDPDGNWHIFDLNVTDPLAEWGIVQLTDGAYNDEFATYSPDARYIAYLRLNDSFDKAANTAPYPYELVIKRISDFYDTPGFSFVSILLVIPVIILMKRRRKR